MQKTLQLVSNQVTEVPAVVESAGAADAGKIPALDGAGRLAESMMPVGIGADTAIIPASEVLAAGNYVNLYDNSGATNARKADASAAGKKADGFVLAAVSMGANATVYFEGPNTQLTGLTPGATYVLSHTTPGGVLPIGSGTTTAGQILQVVGKAISSTEIRGSIADPVVRG